MVFPSEVLAEDNDDEGNFRQAIAAAKEKYLKKGPKKGSAAHRSSSDHTGYFQNGGQDSLDGGAFSGRATQRRRDARDARQFRTDIHRSPSSTLSAAQSDSRTPTRSRWAQASPGGGFQPASTPSVVSSLAKRLLGAEQKPIAGPPQHLLDKFKLTDEQSHGAPAGAFGNKYRRREKSVNHVALSSYSNSEPAAAAMPSPPPTMHVSSVPRAREPRYRDRFERDPYYKPIRNTFQKYDNAYDVDNIIAHMPYDGKENILRDDDGEQLNRKTRNDDDGMSKADTRQLLKDHFSTRAHMDAILKEMQASGNLMSRNPAVSSERNNSRKRSQAAQRYDKLQMEKYGGVHQSAEVSQTAAGVLESGDTAVLVEAKHELSAAANDAEADAEGISLDERATTKSLLARRQQSKKLKKQRKRTTEQEQHEAVANPPVPKSVRVLTKPPVALDCEFVGVGPRGEDDALARVSVVNEIGDVLYNRFVRPREPVTDYRTDVSGVRPQDVSRKNAAAVDFTQAQRDIAELIADRIVVGHAIGNDLKALQLSHPRHFIRDTQTYMPFKELGGASRPSLRKLAKAVLALDIHTGQHDSVEDARIAMQLYMSRRSEWERKLVHGEAKHYGKKRKRQEEFNWRHGSKRLERRMPRNELGVRQRGSRRRQAKTAHATSAAADDGALAIGAVTSGVALDR